MASEESQVFLGRVTSRMWCVFVGEVEAGGGDGLLSFPGIVSRIPS